ncbi:MAG TPA: ABC transporter ATP-binding protein [Chthoniobacteraceae bacterium]|jgi:lipopolysaccharide transport system ATP-binding protein
MSAVIRVEGVSKRYRLGVVNRRMLYEDLQSRWARWRGKADPNASLDAKNPAAAHGDLWALKDINFEVHDGDVLGVIGHNGSGKSTLLKILSQITAPTSGRALIKGKVASLLEVGTGFHPELTGRDNVYLNGVILGMRRDEVARKFEEIVAFSGVETFIDTPVKRYSSGMRVRLAFAVAAHLDPEILVIDEVLAVGDQSFQQKCLGKISEVARAGRTVLFVSHNAAAVENLCTRGIVLERGELVFSGTQSEAIQTYVNRQDRSDTASLAERKDRAGTGEVRIVGIKLRGANGEPTNTAVAGQPLELHLAFRNPSGQPFPNLIAMIQVRTHFDAPVFTQQNRLTGDSFGALPESGAFVCRIPRLPLPAAAYRVGFLLNAQAVGGRVLDSIEYAIDLPVATGDFFGTGILPAVQRGVCLVDGEWRLETEAEVGALAIS